MTSRRSLALAGSFVQVVLGACVPAESAEGDAVEGCVGLPVAAAVQSSSARLAG